MDIINEFLQKTKKENKLSDGHTYIGVRPRIICVGGVSLSVQASDGMYCSPRTNDAYCYEMVEVGYPSIRPPETWMRYFDGDWQKKGLIGSLLRIWKNKKSIWYVIKNYKNGISKWNLKYHLNLQDNATMSVYAYIPIELVEQFVLEHGGINWDESLKEKRNGCTR